MKNNHTKKNNNLLVKRETRIMREPAMVITAHNTDLMVTIIVHILHNTQI